MIALGGVFATAPAHAATIVVTTTADVDDANDGLTSIREAFAEVSAAGDGVVELAANETYLLTRCYSGTDAGPLAAVAGSGPGAEIVVVGNGATIEQTCEDFDGMTVAGAVRIEHLRMRKGCIGVPYFEAPLAWLTVSFVQLEDCAQSAINGLSDNIHLTMIDSRVTRSAGTNGENAVSVLSAVMLRSSIDHNVNGMWVTETLSMVESHFDHNTGRYPSVVAVGPLTAVDSTFDDNTAIAEPVSGNSQPAGLTTFSRAQLTRVSVSRNTGREAGLGTRLSPTESSSIVDSHIDDNVATAASWPPAYAGVSVFAEPTTPTSLTIEGTTVNGNRGEHIAGINSRGHLSLSRSSVIDNHVTTGSASDPVGIIVGARDISITRSTIAGNSVVNSAPGDGRRPFVGGVRTVGTVTVDNSTITGNSGDVGGLHAGTGGTIVESTMADNVGVDAANIDAAGDLVLRSSVISSEGLGVVSCRAAPGVFLTSSGHNFDSGSNCGIGAAVGDVSPGGDPRLGAIGDGGGPTPTRAPLPGSPLIDVVPATAPSCTGSDQRGVARPQGGRCDVGAVEVTQPGTRFHPLTPVRVLDSRTLLGGWGSPLDAGTPRSVTVTGGPVPSTATAVVANVTATNASRASFLNIWPTGTPEPNASSLNFAAGETIANAVTVKIGGQGQIQISNNGGLVDVVIDLVGYFDDGSVPGDRWTGLLNTTRLLDSRTTTGGWSAKLSAGVPRDLIVRGVGGVPTGATAVIANVTATDSTAGSFVRVWPSGTPPPGVSNLNFGPGQTIANLVTVAIGANGGIRLATAMGATHVIVDVVGYFDPSHGAVFRALPPGRVLDDRVGVGASGPWQSNVTRSVAVTGSPVAPAAVGVAMNLTVTNPTAGSFVTAFPFGEARPLASTINFGPGQTIANHVVLRAGVSTDGKVALYNQQGSVDLVADVVGYYAMT